MKEEKIVITETDRFSQGPSRARISNKWCHVDREGKPIYEKRFDNVSSFSEGVAAVKHLKWWFYIDEKGKAVNNNQFTYASTFKNGLARVKRDGKYFYIRRSGFEPISSQRFDYACSFEKDRALVRIGEDWFYINLQGNTTSYDEKKAVHDHFSRTGANLIETGNHIINTAESRVGRLRFGEGRVYVNIKDKHRPLTDLRDLAVVAQNENKKVLAILFWDSTNPINSRRLEISRGKKLSNSDYDLFMIYNQEEIDELTS